MFDSTNYSSDFPNYNSGCTDIWSVRVLYIGEGRLFEGLRVASQPQFRYVKIRLAYVYQGSGRAELYPNTVVLVCFDPSPLHGLARSPAMFRDEDTQQVAYLDVQSPILSVEAGTLHRATFVYEFHRNCRAFRLYFPGCEGIIIA